ncbi:MAG: ISAs1 family transposase [Gammaproteobacteria bacterium]|nr:ISAs1 family transposase [Gammaproteobacteria bacterium]
MPRDAGFSRWVADLAQLTEGEVIAIDGKTIRRSLDTASKKAAIHMVSAWAQQNRLVLGQEKVDDKSNEITAIPKLLKQLDITGAVVTIDAMGRQKKIARQVVGQGGDYVLSLKGNQSALHDDVVTWFQSSLSAQEATIDVDAGHGRIETRQLRTSNDIQWLKARHPDWKGLQSIVEVTSQRELKEKTETETRYFISSLDDRNPVPLGQAIRGHWGIENSLHWVLDVAFDEDRNRARKGHSATNLAMIRHLALNLIQQEKTAKVGVKTKRAKAGWDNQYLLKILDMI